MRTEIDRLLAQHRGVATRSALLGVVSESRLDDEIRRDLLVRVFRRTYCRPWDADLVATLERAAIRSVGPPATLSHESSLRRWGLVRMPAEVQVSITSDRMSRPQPGLWVHRVRTLPPAIDFDGVPVATPAAALVQCWPSADDRRALVIRAVRGGHTTPGLVGGQLDAATRLAQRGELAELLGLLADGCESELEIWGHLGVFDVPGLRHGKRQHWTRVGGRWVRLDLAFIDERVAVEMDGDAFHSAKQHRERDRRRDAALARVGWLTLRFTHDRLHADVAGCRADALGALAARR